MTITKSEKETFKLGQKLARRLKGGEIIALKGDLGAGKTIFIKGIAKGLGIKQTITSPSFILMKIYPVKFFAKIKYLCHVDAYRLKNSQELVDIGINDWLGKKKVITVIEWSDQVEDILPKKRIEIKIDFGKKENERRIEVISYKLSRYVWLRQISHSETRSRTAG